MNLFKNISELLRCGESLVTAVIVSRSGSAPRAVGSRMAIRKDGSILGTIGGGMLEAQAQSLAKKVFNIQEPVLKEFLLTNEDAGRLGMVCGGQVEVLHLYLDASNASVRELYHEIASAIEERKRGWLITQIPSENKGSGLQHLSTKNGFKIGMLANEVVEELAPKIGMNGYELIAHRESRFFIEPLSMDGTVYIFGAGHVSQQLAPLAKLVGFETIVLDDRREFANRERFDSADGIIVLDSYERAMEGLDIDEESYLVLVTRGHAHDKTVLGLALRTNAGYIGMIGSRKKRDAVYEALLEEGFSREEFERVRSPIGINIKAETPEEIAVSIVAELIEARAKKTQ